MIHNLARHPNGSQMKWFIGQQRQRKFLTLSVQLIPTKTPRKLLLKRIKDHSNLKYTMKMKNIADFVRARQLSLFVAFVLVVCVSEK
jgi:hypothetical protein